MKKKTNMKPYARTEDYIFAFVTLAVAILVLAFACSSKHRNSDVREMSPEQQEILGQRQQMVNDKAVRFYNRCIKPASDLFGEENLNEFIKQNQTLVDTELWTYGLSTSNIVCWTVNTVMEEGMYHPDVYQFLFDTIHQQEKHFEMGSDKLRTEMRIYCIQPELKMISSLASEMPQPYLDRLDSLTAKYGSLEGEWTPVTAPVRPVQVDPSKYEFIKTLVK